MALQESDAIQVSGSEVGDLELAAMARVFDSGYIGMGAEVVAFENELEQFFGRSTDVHG